MKLLRIIPDIVKEPHPEGAGRLCTMPPESSVAEAARRMSEENVSAVAVTGEDGSLRGIVSEGDLVRRVLASGLVPAETPLSEVMTPDRDTLAPDDLAHSAAVLMRERGYRHLPVVDGNGAVVAMVTMRDLHAALADLMERETDEEHARVFGVPFGG